MEDLAACPRGLLEILTISSRRRGIWCLWLLSLPRRSPFLSTFCLFLTAAAAVARTKRVFRANLPKKEDAFAIPRLVVEITVRFEIHTDVSAAARSWSRRPAQSGGRRRAARNSANASGQYSRCCAKKKRRCRDLAPPLDEALDASFSDGAGHGPGPPIDAADTYNAGYLPDNYPSASRRPVERLITPSSPSTRRASLGPEAWGRRPFGGRREHAVAAAAGGSKRRGLAGLTFSKDHALAPLRALARDERVELLLQRSRRVPAPRRRPGAGTRTTGASGRSSPRPKGRWDGIPADWHRVLGGCRGGAS